MKTETQYASMSPLELLDELRQEFDTPLTDEIVKRLRPTIRAPRPRYKLEEPINGHDT